MNILTTLALLVWPIVIMASLVYMATVSVPPINLKTLLIIITINYYPVIIFIIYKIFNKKFFIFSAEWMILLAFVVVTFSLYLFGIFHAAKAEYYGFDEKLGGVAGDSVYYKGARVRGADPDTFQRIMGIDGFQTDYAIDKNNVFHIRDRIEGADPNTFRQLTYEGGETEFYADKFGVYYTGKRLQQIDESDFVLLSYYYGRQDSKIYFQGTHITEADAATFSILSNYIAQDKNNVYRTSRIENIVASPKDFQLLDKEEKVYEPFTASDGVNTYMVSSGEFKIIDNK